MEVRLVGAELFHAFGQMDRHDGANSRVCNFAKAPKIEYSAGNIPLSHQFYDLIVVYLTVALRHTTTYLTLRQHLMQFICL